jgi:hypothetical protein
LCKYFCTRLDDIRRKHQKFKNRKSREESEKFISNNLETIHPRCVLVVKKHSKSTQTQRLFRPGRGASHPIPSSCRGSRTGRAIPLLPLLGPQGFFRVNLLSLQRIFLTGFILDRNMLNNTRIIVVFDWIYCDSYYYQMMQCYVNTKYYFILYWWTDFLTGCVKAMRYRVRVRQVIAYANIMDPIPAHRNSSINIEPAIQSFALQMCCQTYSTRRNKVQVVLVWVCDSARPSSWMACKLCFPVPTHAFPQHSVNTLAFRLLKGSGFFTPISCFSRSVSLSREDVMNKDTVIEVQSNSVLTSWKGLNILCRYKRGFFLITDGCNFMVNGVEVISTAEYLTL